MPDRFFVESPVQGAEATLSGAEAHHLAHVLRAAVGQEVLLFDGSGYEFVARIAKIAKHGVVLTVEEQHEVCRELPVPVVLCAALPKGDRQKWLIEKATELGAAALVPMVTQRGVAQPTATALERLRRWVIEASKQCGRNRLLEIREPVEVAALGDSAPPGARRMFAHFENALPLADAFSLPQNNTAAIYFAIGPEGGFTTAEAATLVSDGWQAVSLGERILRVETAAVMALAFVAAQSRR